MGRSYSTRDVRAQESFEYWQNLVGSTYSAFTRNTNLTEGDFQGELSVKSLGRSALITRIFSTPMEYHEKEASKELLLIITPRSAKSPDFALFYTTHSSIYIHVLILIMFRYRRWF